MSYLIVRSLDAQTEDGRPVQPVVTLYGSEDNPSFDHRRGSFVAYVAVPRDAHFAECPDYGSVELFCSAIGHVGPEALLSFADEPLDPDFQRMGRSDEVPPMTPIMVLRPPKGGRVQ